MDRRKPTPFTIVLWIAAAALLVLIISLIPKTVGEHQQLQTVLNATPTPTAIVQSALLVTYDPNNTPTPTPLILRIGSANDEVTRLQERLKELAFYTGEVDGKYGQGTAEAVRWFQTQHNLTADGLAGSETLAVAFSPAAQPFVPTPTPNPSQTPPTVLKSGDEGETVRALQERLGNLGFYTDDIDGNYGNNTERAVRRFQGQHGLTVDGVAGAITLARIYSDQAQRLVATPVPDPAKVPMLVNKEFPIPEGYVPTTMVNLRRTLPSDLVYVAGSDIEGDETAVAALEQMLRAAKAAGIPMFQVSAGYRSVRYQQQLFDKTLNDYLADGRTRASAISATRQKVADPGTSEHHTGLAFDMTVRGSEVFKGTKQQIWMHANCWDYGFIVRYQEGKQKFTGFIAEEWHIRYVGVQHSIPMRDQKLCLEEYVEMLGR